MNTQDRAELVTMLLERRPEFLGFLLRRLGDGALAEDLLQDAYARLDKLDTLRDGESAVAWFYRVLRNASIDHARRAASRSRALSSLAAELAEDVVPDEAPANTCRCVGALKDQLKPTYRDVLERVEVEGTSVKDYAAEAGISPNNAAVRIFRARDELRKQVSMTCGSCAENGCLDCTCGS